MGKRKVSKFTSSATVALLLISLWSAAPTSIGLGHAAPLSAQSRNDSFISALTSLFQFGAAQGGDSVSNYQKAASSVGQDAFEVLYMRDFYCNRFASGTSYEQASTALYRDLFYGKDGPGSSVFKRDWLLWGHYSAAIIATLKVEPQWCNPNYLPQTSEQKPSTGSSYQKPSTGSSYSGDSYGTYKITGPSTYQGGPLLNAKKQKIWCRKEKNEWEVKSFRGSACPKGWEYDGPN